MANCELASASTLSRPPARPRLEISQRRPAPVASDLRPRRPQRLQERGDGTTAEGLIAIEHDRSSREQCHRRQKAQRRPREPRVHRPSPPPLGLPAVPVTSVSPPTSTMRAPSARSPAVIAAVSSLSSTRLSTALPSARAAITSRRLVKLLRGRRLERACDRAVRDDLEHGP